MRQSRMPGSEGGRVEQSPGLPDPREQGRRYGGETHRHFIDQPAWLREMAERPFLQPCRFFYCGFRPKAGMPAKTAGTFIGDMQHARWSVLCCQAIFNFSIFQ